VAFAAAALGFLLWACARGGAVVPSPAAPGSTALRMGLDTPSMGRLRSNTQAIQEDTPCGQKPHVPVVAFAVVFRRIDDDLFQKLSGKDVPIEERQESFERFVRDWCQKFYREGFTKISVAERTDQTKDTVSIILQVCVALHARATLDPKHRVSTLVTAVAATDDGGDSAKGV
jgi:hypothetical protein